MSITITTKYLRPTISRGGRIKATPEFGKSITIPYAHALNGRDNHTAAVQAWLKREGLIGQNLRFAVGSVDCGYVYVNDPDYITFAGV